MLRMLSAPERNHRQLESVQSHSRPYERKKSIHLLLVEDNAVFVFGLEVMLGFNGFTIAGIARNQAEAIHLVDSVPADVALVDLHIPLRANDPADYLNGLATIQALRAA